MLIRTYAILLGYSFATYANPFSLLSITPSEESIDYIRTKQQFQLHTLVTEGRHPKTRNLSSEVKYNTRKALDSLFSVDEDITARCLNGYDLSLQESVSSHVLRALIEGRKIYIYGCGATGRLAKQIESCFWRPFWEKMQTKPYWEKINKNLPGITDRLIGEITGGDRALISSLEGFEDLFLIGNLQLRDHDIGRGDILFAVTEGGETSSVIGTLETALSYYENDPEEGAKRLFFVYNNPDSVLLSLDRSRKILESQTVTKIPLHTGPQAITGSTRMQAATSETFVIGAILEHAVSTLLAEILTEQELTDAGIKTTSFADRIYGFVELQKTAAGVASELAALTDAEASTYAEGGKTVYQAQEALIPVFIDVTERAPTFRLAPLDPVDASEQKSLIQIKTTAPDAVSAWKQFLHKPFQGLSQERYRSEFSSRITDPFLREKALASISRAGNDQQYLYDFSLGSNDYQNLSPKDLVVFIVLKNESTDHLPDTLFSRSAILIETDDSDRIVKLRKRFPGSLIVSFSARREGDIFRMGAHIPLKMILNTHSTAVMAKIGRVVKNTMVYVNPGNLKLIGRATFLIQSHVNEILPPEEAVSYEEANALLFEAKTFPSKYAETALSIVRILEAYKENRNVSFTEAEQILMKTDLDTYLENYTTLPRSFTEPKPTEPANLPQTS